MSEHLKTFIHTFTNGQTITLQFDFSKPMPYCESNLILDKQPVSILHEYRIWMRTVVLPEVTSKCTLAQLRAFVAYGLNHLNQLK